MRVGWRVLERAVQGVAGVACVALAAMMVITCLDVLLRTLGYPVKGGYDLIRVCGAVTVGCAMPLTTAMKGHVAIEYFFNKLNRRARLVVDSVMRALTIVAFVWGGWECLMCGVRFMRTSKVTDTIELPLFWVPWLIALSLLVSALVVVFQLVNPRGELVRI